VDSKFSKQLSIPRSFWLIDGVRRSLLEKNVSQLARAAHLHRRPSNTERDGSVIDET